MHSKKHDMSIYLSEFGGKGPQNTDPVKKINKHFSKILGVGLDVGYITFCTVIGRVMGIIGKPNISVIQWYIII